MKILVIVPAYNEEECIESTIRDLCSECPTIDYLIVNDGSTDATRQICVDNSYNYLDMPVNSGLTCGFQAGMKYAYKKTDLSDEYYTETAPTTAGHHHVRATSPDGFQNMADFYIYDPPTPISPLTFNYDVQTLATFQNTPGGYFNFRIPHADWTPRNAPVMYQAGTFTVQYIQILGNQPALLR